MSYFEHFAKNRATSIIEAVLLLMHRSNPQAYDKQQSNSTGDFTVVDALRNALKEIPAYQSDKCEKHSGEKVFYYFAFVGILLNPFGKFLTSDFAICHFDIASSESLKSY